MTRNRWTHTFIMVTSILSLVAVLTLAACAAPSTPTPAPTTPPPTTPTPKPTTTPPTTPPTTTPAAITLKFASFQAPPPAPFASVVKHWGDEVEKQSGGRLKIQYTWGGALGGLGEMLRLGQQKIVDIVHGAWVSYPEQFPLGTIDYSFPFAPVDPEITVAMKWSLYDKVPAFNQEMEKAGLKVVFIQPVLPYNIMSKVPIVKLDDFKGKKIGVIGRWFPSWVQAAGATPVAMAVTERYEAFARGVIDGELLTIDNEYGFKFYEVAKHYTMANLGSINYIGLWINLDSWKALPADLQNILLNEGRASGIWGAKYMKDNADFWVNEFKKAGVTFYDMPEAERAKWAQAMPDTPAQWAADVTSKGLPGYDLVSQYMKLAEAAGHKWPRQWGQK